MHDPAFERLGLRLAGPEDERVQARFGNRGHLLPAAGGIDTVDPLFIVIQSGDHVSRVADAKTGAHVPRHET